MLRSLIRSSSISLVLQDFGFTLKPRLCWLIRSTPTSNIHTSINKLSPKVDHYKVLGVSRNSSQKEIRKAYIELAKKYHPDTNSGNDDASKLFQQIAIAYTILSSKEQRRAYDASLETEQSQTFESFRRSTSQSSYQSPYETFHSSVNPEELFRKIFGTEFNQSAKYGAESDREWIDYSGTEHGSHQTQTTIVRLTFREAAKGCEKIIQARTLTVCEKCMGIGGEPGKALQLCPFCDGIGYEIVDGLEEKFRVTCRFCKGKGHNVVHKCNHCLGYGQTLVERKIVVPIPAGVTDGETFKINVEPSEGDAARGTIGVQQIFLKFRVEPSDYFSVDGADLHSSATISIPQAIYGGRIQIDGLWSDETIQIEPGTDSHTVVKLGNKGLKDPNSSGYGDHFVHLKIAIPKKLTPEEDGLLGEYSRIENLTVGSINHVQKDSKSDPNSRNATDPEISEQARAAQRNIQHTVGSILIMEHHRPGPLKQKNKPHKAPKKRVRHNSLNSNSSRINLNGNGNRKEFRRFVRKNQLQQIRKLKRDEILNTRRKIAVAPILISVIDFGNRIDTLWNLLQTFDPTATIKTSKHGNSIHVDVPKFRTRYQLALLNPKDLYSSIDLARISDFLLVIHSVDVETDRDESDESFIFDAIYHHCLPNNLHAFIGLDGVDVKHRNNIKRSVFEQINQKYPGIIDGISSFKTLDTGDDLKQLLFTCSTMDRRNKPNSYSSFRSQLLAEEFDFVPNPDDPNKGTLQVDGFIRHNPLDVNSLVYIPEFGEFQMEMIERLPNPFQNSERKQQSRMQFEDFGFKILADPAIRPSLIRENPVETIFDEEIRCMEEDMGQSLKTTTMVEKKKVPKGTSEYQACWIVESDHDEDQEDQDDENEFVDNQDFEPKNDDDEDEGDADICSEMDTQESENEVNNDHQTVMDYDQEINMEEEKQTLIKFKEQRMYEMFPDEIDTPIDRTARERFSKYRGLKSFRTSVWDKNENLPPDYSRIFQLANFDRTKRRLMKARSSMKLMEQQQSIPMEPGFYVRCHVINVPRQLYDFYHNEQPEKPLILNELLPNEHRMSVMNIILKKSLDYSLPIESKECLVFHVGYRRFLARPIFSAHTNGDKHKYEKYLCSQDSGGGVCVATIYAPITYPPASVLVYKQCADQKQPKLVATGTVKDCCPERLVIKRYVLSGHPYKINRKHAVVRYMFFNREDILWFRPVELRTKHGHHGHIIEPLGTHGHMKCRFNKQLSSQDTVLMYLYKRIFPKWFYEPIMLDDIGNEQREEKDNGKPDGCIVGFNSVPSTTTTFMDIES